MTNGEKATYNLDPTKKSTKDINIPDSWLVHHGLDPNEADPFSDDDEGIGDNLVLLDEYISGGTPTIRDTDADGKLDGLDAAPFDPAVQWNRTAETKYATIRISDHIEFYENYPLSLGNDGRVLSVRHRDNPQNKLLIWDPVSGWNEVSDNTIAVDFGSTTTAPEGNSHIEFTSSKLRIRSAVLADDGRILVDDASVSEYEFGEYDFGTSFTVATYSSPTSAPAPAHPIVDRHVYTKVLAPVPSGPTYYEASHYSTKTSGHASANGFVAVKHSVFTSAFKSQIYPSRENRPTYRDSQETTSTNYEVRHGAIASHTAFRSTGKYLGFAWNAYFRNGPEYLQSESGIDFNIISATSSGSVLLTGSTYASPNSLHGKLMTRAGSEILPWPGHQLTESPLRQPVIGGSEILVDGNWLRIGTVRPFGSDAESNLNWRRITRQGSAITIADLDDYLTFSRLLWRNGRFLDLADLTNSEGEYVVVDDNDEGLLLAVLLSDFHSGSLDILIPVDMAVDANRDGVIKFSGNFGESEVAGKPQDRTSEEKPFRFWINDDDDKNYSGTEGERVPSSIKDCEDGTISSTRDLEDLTRLHVYYGELKELVRQKKFKIGFKWTNTNGTTPAVNIFRSASSNGSAEYLTDETIGQQQIQNGYANKLVSVSGTSAVILPDSAAQGESATPLEHLLFEGSSRRGWASLS